MRAINSHDKFPRCARFLSLVSAWRDLRTESFRHQINREFILAWTVISYLITDLMTPRPALLSLMGVLLGSNVETISWRLRSVKEPFLLNGGSVYDPFCLISRIVFVSTHYEIRKWGGYSSVEDNENYFKTRRKNTLRLVIFNFCIISSKASHIFSFFPNQFKTYFLCSIALSLFWKHNLHSS